VDFAKNKSSRDGFRSICKTCKKSADKVYRTLNKKEIEKRQKRYYLNNKSIFYSNNAVRRANFKKAKPAWLTEQQELQINYFYSLAKDCQTVSGETYHVDHIVPLKGASVCGLHVPWNLQVIPSDLNSKKYNKFEGGW
jgi:hypothetical protein